MNKTIKAALPLNKMIIFDMDDVIFEGNFLHSCAEKFYFLSELENLYAIEDDPINVTKSIGQMLNGRTISELLDVADNMKMVSNATDVIRELKKKNT